MNRPNIHTFNALTGILDEREMTQEEYADLIASGWTEEALEQTPTE